MLSEDIDGFAVPAVSWSISRRRETGFFPPSCSLQASFPGSALPMFSRGRAPRTLPEEDASRRGDHSHPWAGQSLQHPVRLQDHMVLLPVMPESAQDLGRKAVRDMPRGVHGNGSVLEETVEDSIGSDLPRHYRQTGLSAVSFLPRDISGFLLGVVEGYAKDREPFGSEISSRVHIVRGRPGVGE